MDNGLSSSIPFRFPKIPSLVIRSVYCFAPYGMPGSINPLKFSDKLHELHRQQLDIFYELSEQSPLGGSKNDGRITLGLGYDQVEYRPLDERLEGMI
jgi:hypothetical protein